MQVPTSHGKADLTIYRDASARILTVLCSKFPACIVELSSIDEVYLDVTAEAAKWLEQADSELFLPEAIQTLLAIPSMIAGDDTAEVLMSRRQISKGHSGTEMLAASYSNVNSSNNVNNDPNSEQVPVLMSSWFARPASQWSTEDKLMLCGALVINQLRRAVFEELGFTCSAGIANNKMLAKLSSAMHKPNKQTLAPACVIPALMKDLPYSRIQGLGGKLGTTIETLYGEKVRTMGQILATPKHEWTRHFGEETAVWLHNVARGIDLEPVLNRSLPISIGCSKSFRSTMMLTPAMILDGTVLHWITELANELQERVTADTKTNSRIPRNLHCGASVKIFPNGEIPTNADSLNVSSTNGTNNNPLNNTNNVTGGTTDPDYVVANWHEQAGFSLSKICPMQSLNGSTPLMARTAFQMLIRTILEHPKFTSVYGSNINVPQLGAIVPNTAAGGGNSTINTSNSYGNGSSTSSNTSHTGLTSPSKAATSSILPSGWAITGISLGATNFQTIESGASSIRNYFGTSAKSENSTEYTSTTSNNTAVEMKPIATDNANMDGSSTRRETLETKPVGKPASVGGIRDLFARQSAAQGEKEATLDGPVTIPTAPPITIQPVTAAAPVVTASVSIRDLLMKQPSKHLITTNEEATPPATTSTAAEVVYDLTDINNNDSTTIFASVAAASTNGSDIRHWASRRGPPLDTISHTSFAAEDESKKIDLSETTLAEGFLEGGDVIIEEVSSQLKSSQLPHNVADLSTSSTYDTSVTIIGEPSGNNSIHTSPTTSTTNNSHSYKPRSMGDIDSAVFLTLPAEIQREIELTMKLRAHTQQNRPIHKIGNVASILATKTTTSNVTDRDNRVESGSSLNGPSSAKLELKQQPESMMDVDSAVFLSLPADIQREIELTMKLRQQRKNSGASTHIHRPAKGKK